MPGLFAPITLRDLTLPDCVVVFPTCQSSGVDGHASDWHFVYLARGAVGLIAISPRTTARANDARAHH